jgi:hypothetical protein
VDGPGTGPVIKAKSPPPAKAPPLTEDDIYGTVTYLPPGSRAPGSLVRVPGASSAATAARAAGAAQVALALVLAVVLALAASA